MSQPVLDKHATERWRLLLQEVNARIRQVSERSYEDGGEVAFLCECGDQECTSTLELTLAQYDGRRAAGDPFILSPEHSV